MLDDHFALGIKFVEALGNGGAVGEGLALHELLAQVESDASGDFVAAVVDEVVAAFKLHQLIGLLQHAVDVKLVVNDAVLLAGYIEHPAVGAEFVSAGLQQTVGAGHLIGAGDGPVAAVDVVVVFALLHQAGSCGNTLFQIGGAVVADEDAGMVRHIVAHQHALFGELVELGRVVALHQDGDVLMAVALPVEGVGLAQDGGPGHVGVGIGGGGTAVEGGTVAEFGALLVLHPGAHGAAVFVKGVGNAVDGLLAHSQLVGGVGEALAAVLRILPAGDQLTGDGIVQLAVHFKDAGAGFVDMAAALVGADEPVLQDLIVVGNLNSGQNGAPIHHGLAGFAVGSVFIAALSGGGFPVLNRQLRVVGVVGRGNGSQLSRHQDAAAEGGIVQRTVNHPAVDVDHGLIAQAGQGLIGTGDIVEPVVGPDAHRDADQGLARGLRLGGIGHFHGDGQQLGNGVVGKDCLKALGYHSALGLPGVGVVQLQGGHQLVRLAQIGHVDIHVVDGLGLGRGAGVVVAGEGHHRVTRHGEGPGNSGGIAHGIPDLEGHGVAACAQNHILPGGEGIAGDSGLDGHAVHADAAGAQIQAGIVGDLRGEGDLIAVNHRTVCQRQGGIGGGVGRLGDGGQDPVIHRGAVVQGDVVNVEGDDIGGVGLHIGADKGRGTGISLVRCHGGAEEIILGNVDGHVNPAGFGDIGIGRGVQVGPVAGGSGGEHEMVLYAGVAAAGVFGVQLGLEGQALARRGEGIFGDVQPHTQGSGLLSVFHIPQDDGFPGVEQHIVRPAGEGCIGVIQSPGQGVIAVAHLAAAAAGGHEGGAAQVFIELAGQGIAAHQGVVHAVFLAPLLCFREAHETGLVAVLKVEDHLGSLAERNGVDQHGIAVGDRHLHAGDFGVVGGCKAEALQRTGSLIGQGYGYRVGIHIHIGLTDHGHDGQLDGADLIGSGIGHGGGGCGQLEDLGVRHSDGPGAHHGAAGDQLNVHIAPLAAGNESALFDGAEAIIGQGPGGVGGHIHGVAVGIDGLGAEGVDGPGGEDIVFGLDVDVIQNAGGRHIGSHEDAVGGGALGAVTGHGAHGVGFLTHTLGQEGGGTAAVAVGGPLAAQSQHGFALLIAAEAHGVVGATAVVHDKDQGAVLLDAHHGAGGIVAAPLLRGVHQLAVLDHHGEGNTHRVEQHSLCQVLLELGLVECLDVAGDIALPIPEHIQDGGGGIQHGTACGHLLTEVADALAVVDQNAGRIGAVVQVGVHAADDVVAQLVFIISGHLGQLLVCPVCFIIRVLGQLINLIVAGDDGNIRVGRVHLDHMEHLSAGAGGVVEHDFRLNRRAGDKDIVLLGNHVVVAVGTEAGSLEYHVLFFPVGNGCQGGSGHQPKNHCQGQQHGNCAYNSLVHKVPPLIFSVSAPWLWRGNSFLDWVQDFPSQKKR